MSETGLRDLLATALPEQPPTPLITRETAIAAGRQAVRRRRHRTYAALLAVFCAVALGAGVGPWLARGVGGVGTGAATATPDGPTPTSTVDPTPTPTAAVTEAMPADPIAASSLRLRAAAQRLLPQATFAPVTISYPGGNRSMTPFELTRNESGYYVAWADVRGPNTVGTIIISVWPGADGKKSAEPGCDANYQPLLSCETRTGPAGEQITIESGQQIGTDVIENEVKIHRADGEILVGLALTSVITSNAYSTIPPGNRQPPLNLESLVELMLTPGVTVRAPVATLTQTSTQTSTPSTAPSTATSTASPSATG